VHAGKPAMKYSGVSGHAGTFKSPQTVAIPEADGHASAGSVKAAAALANHLAPPVHAGKPAMKYSGVSGHAGTFKSPQIVSIPESNGPAASNHATGTVKIAAGLVHKAEASGMKSFGNPVATFKYSGVSGHAGTFKSPSTVTVPEAQGYKVAHSLAAHAPQAGSVKFAAQQLAVKATTHSTNPISAAIAAHNAGPATAVGVVGGLGHGEVSKIGNESYTDQSGLDGQGSGHDGQLWHPSFGYVNNWDGGRGEAFRDYKQG